MNIMADIKELSDADLLAWAATARDDLENAAIHQHETEWHEACFAAVVTFGMEMGRRGLRLQTTH